MVGKQCDIAMTQTQRSELPGLQQDSELDAGYYLDILQACILYPVVSKGYLIDSNPCITMRVTVPLLR